MKILVICIILIVIVFFILIFLYEIKFTIGGVVYDILIIDRKNHNLGYGIRFKHGLEIYRFYETFSGGSAEGLIYPKYPREEKSKE